MNVSEAIAQILKKENIDWISCFPNNPLIEDLSKIGIRPIMFRHERGAMMAADGYSRTSDREKIGIFSQRETISYYPFCHDKNKKTFFSDTSYKYGSSSIIFGMEHFKKYVETYSVFHIDKQRDLGESLLFTNPYDKKILIRFKTSDNREIKPLIINPKHATDLDLKCILNNEENEWKGHVQLLASNRAGMFNFKHSFQDPTVISDLEHLDPYRAEPTHLKFFRILRNQLGHKINLIKHILSSK